MRLSVRIGRFGKAPVLIHATSLLWILLFSLRNDLLVSIWAGVLLTLLVLMHELGHAWVCRLVGAEVEKIIVFPFIGYCFYSVDPDSDERDQILIAWGGVFVQFVILLVTLLCFQVFTGSMMMPGYVRLNGMGIDSMTWQILVGFNFGIIVANLAPLPDFDGERAWLMNPLRAARAMWLFWKKQRQ